MAQYIDKDALVAEIEKLIERAKAERVLYPKTILAAKNYLLIEDYNKYLSFINTLEVKEVDLEKERQIHKKQGEQKPNYYHHEVDLSGCSEEYRKAYYDGWNNCNMQHSQCESELDDVVKCLINGMKFYYEDNEEATWGTDKWSMPVKHIIEVLEKQGEQKLVNEVKPKFRHGDRVRNKKSGLEQTLGSCIVDVYEGAFPFRIEDQDDWELVEQPQSKQEWSERDEQTFIKSVEALEDFGKFELADWLKEHKNQF